MEQLKIGNKEIAVKEYRNQRVVTFKDIDLVHERKAETAKYRFRDNKEHFIEGEDYFIISRNDVGANFATTYGFSEKAPKGILLTESGYLMLVKSFTDDLAWTVQRQLVNTYFRFKQIVRDFNQSYPIDTNELNNFLKKMPVIMDNIENLLSDHADRIEDVTEMVSVSKDMIDTQSEKLESIIDNMTLSTRQQEKIHEAAKDRVNFLLGGAHNATYKKNSRMYFINLWNGLKSKFHCGSSWKDLNPVDFDKAIEFIGRWEYQV